jgi:RNA polymerase sigma factor (sigma-70 family)
MAVAPRLDLATEAAYAPQRSPLDTSRARSGDGGSAPRRPRPLASRRLILDAKRRPGRDRDRLVEAYTPLIAHVARAFRGSRNVERIELMQSGVVGLLRALERYDPSYGTPFWGYASFWVRQAMQEHLSEMVRPIVLSDRAARQLARVNHARRDHARMHGGEATTATLAEATGISEGQIGNLAAASRVPRSLDEPAVRGGGLTSALGERLVDPAAEDAFAGADLRIDAEHVPELLASLDDRERALVRARYGIGGDEQTLREVGLTLHVSVERVRQLEARAIEKLRAQTELCERR